jgi:hypothetical protein
MPQITPKTLSNFLKDTSFCPCEAANRALQTAQNTAFKPLTFEGIIQLRTGQTVATTASPTLTAESVAGPVELAELLGTLTLDPLPFGLQRV